MDTKAIADALAACFTGTTATLGTATEAIAYGPTATLPDDIAKGPALLVYLPEGDLSVAMRHREDVLTFAIRLLRDPLAGKRRAEWLYAWYDAMRDKVEANMTLDLAYVAWAQPTGMRAALGGHTYAGVVYDAVELEVTVRLDEIVSTLGA